MSEIKNKNVLIIGSGKEGLSAANYLGNANEVSMYDDKPRNQIDQTFFKNLRVKNVNFYFGSNLPKNVKFDLVVRSPGVRPDHPHIKKLIKSGAILTSTTKLFFDHCPCPIIGVTGTKGKGTTATLIYEMLKTKFSHVFLAGNIGTPMLDILPKLNPTSLVVLELSSFQLIDLTKSPHIAVVLMITSEHLDWHKDELEYQKAKQSIVQYQNKEDLAVINYDFPKSKEFYKLTPAKIYFFSTLQKTAGTYIENNQIISEVENHRDIVTGLDKILLPGAHNLQNILAATAVAKIHKVSNENIAKVLSTFKGLKHRLQLVKKVRGVSYYNDSFSSIPETTIAAIAALPGPKILILGGSSKKSNFTHLAQKISADHTIKTIIVIGQESLPIVTAVKKVGFAGKIIQGAKNMHQIVQLAQKMASRGDTVLMSPACASFDMFKNYQNRGDQFEKEVERLNYG